MNLKAWKILTEGITPDGVSCTTVGIPFGNGNAIELETAIFLYGLIRREQPSGIVIETGTHWGFSSAVIGLALKDNVALYPNQPVIQLYTVDSTEYDQKPERLWKRLKLKNIHRIIADSEFPETYEKLSKNSASLAWYDADHDGPAIFREFAATFPYLNKRRCILGWHDTSLDKRMDGGIRSIIDDLKKRSYDGSGWKKIEYVPLRNMRGLDLIFLSNEDY